MKWQQHMQLWDVECVVAFLSDPLYSLFFFAVTESPGLTAPKDMGKIKSVISSAKIFSRGNSFTMMCSILARILYSPFYAFVCSLWQRSDIGGKLRRWRPLLHIDLLCVVVRTDIGEFSKYWFNSFTDGSIIIVIIRLFSVCFLFFVSFVCLSVIRSLYSPMWFNIYCLFIQQLFSFQAIAAMHRNRTHYDRVKISFIWSFHWKWCVINFISLQSERWPIKSSIKLTLATKTKTSTTKLYCLFDTNF